MDQSQTEIEPRTVVFAQSCPTSIDLLKQRVGARPLSKICRSDGRVEQRYCKRRIDLVGMRRKQRERLGVIDCDVPSHALTEDLVGGICGWLIAFRCRSLEPIIVFQREPTHQPVPKLLDPAGRIGHGSVDVADRAHQSRASLIRNIQPKQESVSLSVERPTDDGSRSGFGRKSSHRIDTLLSCPRRGNV